MELPKRKHPRLKDYNYSQNGYYFVTINTVNNLPILSKVGRGLAHAAECNHKDIQLTPIGEIAELQLLKLEKRYANVRIDQYVIMPTHIHIILVLSDETVENGTVENGTAEDGTAGASPRPTEDEKTAGARSRYTALDEKTAGTGSRYTALDEKTAGTRSRHTVMDIICAYKSLTTRICNKKDHIPGKKVFQTSFYEKIIRNEEIYQQAQRYIEENPLKWQELKSDKQSAFPC